MATDYTYLYEEYPEVISADQLYRICHISKRKAKWLLEHGYIPCEDSGKKTRRYKIRLNDVIDYLRTLEAAPDLVATPVGAFNVKRKQLNPVAQICQKEFQRFLYNIWRDEADILRISDVQVLLGYSAGTIRQWILRKELRSTRIPCGIQVTAKEWLIDFTVRYTSSASDLLKAVSALYDRIVDENLLIRRLSISANKLLPEADVPKDEAEQLDLFTDYAAKEQREQADEAAHARERKIQEAMLGIKKKFGKNAILKGMNLEEGATARERNETIGGHHA